MSRVRIELSSIKLVMTGTLTGDEIEGEAEVPGTKARFHLLRTVKVAPEVLSRYFGVFPHPIPDTCHRRFYSPFTIYDSASNIRLLFN